MAFFASVRSQVRILDPMTMTVFSLNYGALYVKKPRVGCYVHLLSNTPRGDWEVVHGLCHAYCRIQFSLGGRQFVSLALRFGLFRAHPLSVASSFLFLVIWFWGCLPFGFCG
jgi:hypothetical protein